MKKYLLMVLSVFSVSFLMAQDRTVSGTVTDAESGESIPGANIVEKGTSNGTITDFDGNYTVSVGEGTTLVISFVGYTPQEVVVGSRSVIDVALALDVQSLSEVVVVGYGTQEKKEITSAVTSVKSKDFNAGLVNSPAQLIQGKVGGLTVARPGGDPNGSYAIRLRGVASFGANSQPLIVIDGLIGGDLNSVDPSDIESMDVLKDGSAAAIYGTRGSAGVILITTKSGKAGKTQVTYNGSTTIENVANSIEFLNAAEYRAAPGAQDLGSDTDWLDEVTETAMSNTHNISMSGGTPQTTYRASVNVRNVEGVGINSGFNQLNARLNLRQLALNDKLTIIPIISVTARDQQFSFAEGFRNAIIANPTLPVLYDGAAGTTDVGGYAERDIFQWINPVSIVEQNLNEGTELKIVGSMKMEYDFSDYVNGLRFGVFYSQQRENDERGQYFRKSAKFRGADVNGLANRGMESRLNELFETTLNYDVSAGGLDVAFLGGYSYQYFFTEGFSMSGGNFLTDAFTFNNIGASLDFPNGLGNVGSYANSNTLIAAFGRVNFNYDDTYFLSASIRREGSSRFGAENRWGNFPAVSAGANIDQIVDIPVVDNLKVRVSWGVTGNQPSNSYLSLRRFGPQGSYFENGSYLPSYGPVSNDNPDLKWETKKEIDFGFDFTALNGKLSGTFDWYKRTTEDLLFLVNVPVPPNLFGQTWRNVGELENTGVEFSINYDAYDDGNFSYNTGINFATFKTTVIRLDNSPLRTANMGSPGQNATDLVIVEDGAPLGQIFLPILDGFTDAGDLIMRDLDGDGSFCNCDDDKTVVGNGLPDFTLGWNNSLAFGAFDLNLFFRGAFGHELVNSYRGFYENYQSTTVVNYNVVKGPGLTLDNAGAAVNDTHVEDGSFVKLDNATLGYTLPINGDNIGFKNLRIYSTIQNAFVITDYTGIDPEVRYTDIGNGGAFAPGIERRNTYFTTRQITFGLTAEF